MFKLTPVDRVKQKAHDRMRGNYEKKLAKKIRVKFIGVAGGGPRAVAFIDCPVFTLALAKAMGVKWKRKSLVFRKQRKQ